MATTPQNLDEATKQIAQLNKEIKNLGGETFADINAAIKSFGGGIEGARKVIAYMNKDVADLKDTFGTISKTLRNIVDDLNKTRNVTKETEQGFDKLESLTRKIAEHKKDEEILTVKQLKGIQKQTAAEVAKLKALVNQADAAFKLTDAYKEANDALNEQTGFLKDINSLVEKELKTEEKIQKTLGYTGALFGGIQKSLEHIGIESEAFEHLNKDLREAAKSGDGLKVVGAGLKSMGKGIMESFKDPLVQITLIAGAFHELYKIGLDFNKKTFEIQKNLGLSNKEAKGMTMELEHMVVHSGDIADNTLRSFANFKDLEKSLSELNEYYGTSVLFSEEQLTIQAKLQQVAGLNVEEAAKLDEYSASTGKNAQEQYDSIGKINKGVFSQKKVIQEVLKTSGQLAAQYKNNPDLIAKAVVQAQRLGLTLEQTKNISKNLLNFEDSISAELEAELLTGEDLNLERARGLALQGKTAEAAEELMKNLGPNGLLKFQKMLPIQQEAYAKALGMSADELGDSLLKSAKIAQIEKENGAGLSKRIKELKDSGQTEKAALLEQEVLKGKSVTLAEQELDTQEKINKNLEKAKSSLEAQIAPIMGGVAATFEKVTAFLSENKWIANLLGGIGLAAAVAAAAAGIFVIGKLLLNLFKGNTPSDQTAKNTKEIANNTKGMKGGSSSGGGGGGGDYDDYDGPRNKDGSPDKRTTSGRKYNKNKKNRRGKKKGIAGKVLGGLGMVSSLMGMGGDDDEGGNDLVSSAMDMASSTSGSGGGFMSKMMGGASKMMSNLNPMKALKSAFSGPNLKKIVGYLPKVGKLAQLAMTAYSIYSGAKGIAGSMKEGASYQDVGKEAVQSLGDLGGTVVGGILGSIVPGAGTMIGGLLGGMGGSALAGLIADNVDLTGFGKAVVDVLGPGKAMATGGIVTGPTRALIGEAGTEAVIPLDKFYAKLDELISVIKQGGHVYLDGTKVGTAMNVGTYKLQ